MLFLGAALVIVAAAWAVRLLTAPPEIAASIASGSARIAPAFIEPAELDRLISAYEERVVDHTDALDYRTLGYLYLDKGRASGDVSRYLAARQALATAVELFPTDPSGRVGLASAHYSLHQFSAAATEAQLVYDATSRPDALVLLADASTALGDYERATSLRDALADLAGPVPAVLVRQAEAARLGGDGEEAMDLARAAVAAATESANPRLRAWYQAFAAQMAFNLGHYEEGLTLAVGAVEDDPASVTARVTAARLAAATGDRGEAIEIYEDVVETRPDPTFLAELGDLYLLAGRQDDAEAAFVAVETAAALADDAGVYDRVTAVYLADHGLDAGRAVEIAQGDLEQRHDVAAYDTLAWALYAAGRFDEAAEASALALADGALDARASYHAGMIAIAHGDVAAARRLLGDALALSPMFQPLQAERAAVTLADLG